MRIKKIDRRRLLIALFGLLSFLIIGTSEPGERLAHVLSERDPRFHRVVSISDGDTIVVDIDGQHETVRFIGVDTPETHHPSRPVQCFGQAASEFTHQLVGSGPVRLEADPTNTNRDRYDRLLRYVYLRDDTLVNAELIRQGYGFAYLSFPFEKQLEFEAYEKQAEADMRGLWNSCDVQLDNGFPSTNPS